MTAVIREKSPDAGIIIVKVFWGRLTTDITSLVRGIDEATARGAAVVNLSLGTANAAHRPLLQEAVQRVSMRRAVIVAATEDTIDWLPGTLEGVIPAALDWTCPRDEYRLITHRGRRAIATSGYPRDIPNVPRDRNLKGISFAVANASGFVARARELLPGGIDPSGIWTALETGLPERGPRMVKTRNHAQVDAVIIGGGPAGATAAALLAEWGRSVVLVRHPTPGDRPGRVAALEHSKTASSSRPARYRRRGGVLSQLRKHFAVGWKTGESGHPRSRLPRFTPSLRSRAPRPRASRKAHRSWKALSIASTSRPRPASNATVRTARMRSTPGSCSIVQVAPA